MFFIARMVAAMLTGSWGSWRTTRTLERMDSPPFPSSGSAPGPALMGLDAKCCPPLSSRSKSWRAASCRSNRVAAAGGDSLDYWPAGDETIDHDDDRDHQQQVDQSAADVDDEESENPENEQNYR